MKVVSRRVFTCFFLVCLLGLVVNPHAGLGTNDSYQIAHAISEPVKIKSDEIGEIWQLPDGQFVFKTGGEAPPRIYPDGIEIDGTTIKSTNVNIDSESDVGSEILYKNDIGIIAKENWFIYNNNEKISWDSFSEKDLLINDIPRTETVGSYTVTDYEKEAVKEKTMNNIFGSLWIEYKIHEGNPLKHTLKFTANQTGTFSLCQEYSSFEYDEINQYDTDTKIKETIDAVQIKTKKMDSAFLDTMVQTGDFDTKIKERPLLALPEVVEFKKGGKLVLGEITSGAKQDFQSFEFDSDTKTALFCYGDFDLKSGESFVVDPDTFSQSNPTKDGYIQDTNNNGVCSTAGIHNAADTVLAVSWLDSGSTSDCNVAYIEWPTTPIPDSSIISDVVFKFDVLGGLVNMAGCDYKNMLDGKPSVRTPQQIITDIVGAGSYIENDPACASAGDNKSLDLGASADSDLQSLLSSDYFALGIESQEESQNSLEHQTLLVSDEGPGTPDPTLEVTYSPAPTTIPFSQSFPIFATDSICTPLIMNTNTTATEQWFVQAAGGPLTIELIAHSVNSIDPETVVANVYDPSNALVGTFSASYPSGTPAGTEVSSFFSPAGAIIAGDIYRIDITTPLTPPDQPHYRLEFTGAMEAGISSPTFPSLEAEPVKWILNVNALEGLNVDFFTTGVPTPATTVNYTLTSPTGAIFNGTTAIIPGNEISIGIFPSGAWILEIQSIDGHYRLDKNTGSDKGIYVSGISKLECNPTDLVVNKLGPFTVTPGSIINYTIFVDNVGAKVATNVTLIDIIPTEIVGLSLVGASPICGPIQSGKITCDIGDMNPSTGTIIDIDLQIPPATSGDITNNATASSSRLEITPADNSDILSTSVSSGGPTISISDASVTEGHIGSSTMTFTVSLSSSSLLPVTVNFTTQDISAKTTDDDYVGTSGMLTFIPGDTSEPINVTINGDRDFEPNETFYVNLSTPINAGFGDNQGIGIIFNDDLDPFVFVPVNMGGVGTIVPLLGFDFTPASMVTIRFDETVLATISAPAGDFSYPLLVPLATAGGHIINATDGTYQSSSGFNVAAPRLTATNASNNQIIISASPNSTLNLYMKGFAANDPLKMITVYLDGMPVGSPVSPNKVGSFKAFPLTLPLAPVPYYNITATDGTNTKSLTLVGLP